MKKQTLVIIIFLITSTSLLAQTTSDSIVLNQLGFYPHASKIAVVKGNTTANVFYIINKAKNDTAYKDTLSQSLQSHNSSTTTRIADFSELYKKGNYYLYIPNVGNSYTFTISNNANGAAAKAALKGFYYIRSNIPLEEQYAGKWHRPAGHPDTAVLVHSSAASTARPQGTLISTPGGWYDAGDYNKYIVNSGITMGTLLSADEDFSAYFDTLNTNIPESRDKVPDILNEAVYNLRWMLTMQDPNDGGVYHKCTNAAFDGMVMPGVTKLPRYVVQKSTAATLDFAAVTAQAARIVQRYKQQLPGLADSCLKASQKAWQWAMKHPDAIYNQDANNKLYKPAVTTGAYGDNSFKDEWFWAACELYATTQDEQYWQTIINTAQHTLTLPSWNNVYALGVYTLVRTKPAKHLADVEKIGKQVVTFANDLLQKKDSNAFKTVMGGSVKDFNWGSNSNAANQGIALINAYFITKDKKYINGALSNLDYLLGRNATGYCFLTGIGSHSTMHPHHRPSVADEVEEPVRGLLAGGPNPGRQDNCSGYQHFEPETTYLDVDCSYASNEIAINWNAPLVYLANAIEALQQKVKYD
ncbi:cellulase [Ilyomonas limi]|uniref:Endoglucanase n=1 Tax=Ilyomonas limi TaxID=2575867 RepID=A0A4U3LBW1_9BACT|nr:glycoside hydrolase family 9 protein [Ilyomonas limi]TKK71536.1 cellulase [Ilyomonas limi]